MRYRYLVRLLMPSILIMLSAPGCGNGAQEQRIYTERTYIQLQDTEQPDAEASDAIMVQPNMTGAN